MKPPSDSTPRDLTCAEVPPFIGLYIAQELEREAVLRLRAHLARCPECMELYRSKVETTAALGRGVGAEREQRMAERQRVARAAAALGREAVPQSKRRHFRLRMVLIPAVLIYVISQLANLGPQPGKVILVSASAGTFIDRREPDFSLQDPLVLPGRWLTTERFGKASLDAGTCTVDLGGSTELLLESARPVRFRLRRGHLELAGTASVLTVLGLIEVREGRGEIVFDERGLFIEPTSGGWSMVGPDGARELPHGTVSSFRLEL